MLLLLFMTSLLEVMEIHTHWIEEINRLVVVVVVVVVVVYVLI